MLVDLMRYLVRRKVKVEFNDLIRNRPVSTSLGCDRGTPIDRYYIEKFLAAQGDLIRGRVLEVGEDTYSRRFGGGQVESCEVLNVTSTDIAEAIVGDLTDPATLPENAIDCFICTQTFNFIFDAAKAVQGAHALLKPGGVLLATVAGISQISRYDMDRWGDYWRFTTASMKKLFSPVFIDSRPPREKACPVALTARGSSDGPMTGLPPTSRWTIFKTFEPSSRSLWAYSKARAICFVM